MPGSDSPSGSAANLSPALSPGRIWWTRRAVRLHAVIVVVVPAFIALFWWQVQRVREGNTLSWAYVFEWPIFTGYAIYLWWKLVHDQLDEPVTAGAARARAVAARRNGTSAPPGAAPSASSSLAEPTSAGGTSSAAEPAGEDEKLAAYNRYLAELSATGRRKRW